VKVFLPEFIQINVREKGRARLTIVSFIFCTYLWNVKTIRASI
jgi:hypothetical protein